MSESFLKHLSIRVVVALGVMACGSIASGQALPAGSDPGAAAAAATAAAADRAKAYASDAKGYAFQLKRYLADRRQVGLSLTYEDAGANLTYADPITFQSQGGGAELSFPFRKGFAAVGSVNGFHTNQSGYSVPVNVLVEAFGPRYTFHPIGRKHPINIFLQGLVGEANGFKGLYPNPNGPTTSANSLAYEAGGGMDIYFTPHVSIRLLEADWERTSLPNATNNVQNTLRVGIGVVFHTAHRPVDPPPPTR
jgi:predicted porin